MAEGARLESWYTPKAYREFESRPLRKRIIKSINKLATALGNPFFNSPIPHDGLNAPLGCAFTICILHKKNEDIAHFGYIRIRSDAIHLQLTCKSAFSMQT